MKKKIFNIIIVILILCTACKTIQYVPIKGDTVVEYRDTTIWKDSLIYTPVEVVKEVVPYMEPLQMETSLAKAEAYVDTTTRTLKGKIENKKGITEQVKWREKIVYRDSVVTQEIPVEVTKEVVKYRHTFWDQLSWLISGLSISILIIYIVKKLYGTKGKLL